jgi:hypothetical protein
MWLAGHFICLALTLFPPHLHLEVSLFNELEHFYTTVFRLFKLVRHGRESVFAVHHRPGLVSGHDGEMWKRRPVLDISIRVRLAKAHVVFIIKTTLYCAGTPISTPKVREHLYAPPIYSHLS